MSWALIQAPSRGGNVVNGSRKGDLQRESTNLYRVGQRPLARQRQVEPTQLFVFHELQHSQLIRSAKKVGLATTGFFVSVVACLPQISPEPFMAFMASRSKSMSMPVPAIPSSGRPIVGR